MNTKEQKIQKNTVALAIILLLGFFLPLPMFKTLDVWGWTIPDAKNILDGKMSIQSIYPFLVALVLILLGLNKKTVLNPIIFIGFGVSSIIVFVRQLLHLNYFILDISLLGMYKMALCIIGIYIATKITSDNNNWGKWLGFISSVLLFLTFFVPLLPNLIDRGFLSGIITSPINNWNPGIIAGKPLPTREVSKISLISLLDKTIQKNVLAAIMLALPFILCLLAGILNCVWPKRAKISCSLVVYSSLFIPVILAIVFSLFAHEKLSSFYTSDVVWLGKIRDFWAVTVILITIKMSSIFGGLITLIPMGILETIAPQETIASQETLPPQKSQENEILVTKKISPKVFAFLAFLVLLHLVLGNRTTKHLKIYNNKNNVTKISVKKGESFKVKISGIRPTGFDLFSHNALVLRCGKGAWQQVSSETNILADDSGLLTFFTNKPGLTVEVIFLFLPVWLHVIAIVALIFLSLAITKRKELIVRFNRLLKMTKEERIDVKAKLEGLKEMYENELITKELYEENQKKLLEKYRSNE